jgi:hypothetical protein
MTFIVTCNNRPVLSKKWITDDEVIIHDLSDGKGVGHHRNVILDYCKKTKFWMLDDDIEKAYIPGELQPKGYYKKIESVIDLSKITFPKDTALGTLSNAAFPITKKDGFGNVQTIVFQVAYLDTDIIYSKLPNYNYPENNEWPEDAHLTYSCFAHGLKVKKYFGASFHCTMKNSEFNDKRVILWKHELEIINSFKYSTDPRIPKAWKYKFNKGPYLAPNKKHLKVKYQEEIISEKHWI